MVKPKSFILLAWGLTLVTVALAIIVWGQSLNCHIFGTSTYLLFPIFGLVAFSLLWSQYIVLALRNILRLESSSTKTYFNVTGWLVLAAILLHPGLLVWQLWRDGEGLPPSSEIHYVLPGLKWFVILGMINLTILLLFELRRFFANKTWWRPLTYVVDLVILSVFYHGLKLGNQLQHGWYRKVWFFYRFSYIIALVVIYKQHYFNNTKLSPTK